MNKRQKKKLYKNSLIKIKKLHPKQGDVICLMPNLDEIDLGTMTDFLNIYQNSKIFGKSSLVIIPYNVKTMDKISAEMLLEKGLSVVRGGEYE